MDRREFLAKAGMLAAGSLTRAFPLSIPPSSTNQSPFDPDPRISFQTSDAEYQAVYAHALDVLAHNVTSVDQFNRPVLIEGSVYGGIWLECAPQEGLVYSLIRPDAARNNHLAFFALQKDDGQLPCWIRTKAVGFGQIQMVVPVAATAWELSQQTGDSELLQKAYASCSRWDAWLRKYRDTRHTGLCEGFCTWDTGQDNSPRWAGIPNRCPDGDARKCPPLSTLPRLCPDLSATVYGGRVALAAMARALGKNAEADHWLADAHAIATAIVKKLYSPEDACFYDLDAQNHFVRVRGDAMIRVLGEHVVDRDLFETIYTRQIHNPQAFWASYPFPSIALNDPAFVRPIPRNSWGGASQALTALRAPRWMEYYGKPSDLAHLMQQWISAIRNEGEFLQQLDPLTGKFTPDASGYSPAALVFLDFSWRLAGVRRQGDRLEWNIRPLAPDVHASYGLRIAPASHAEIKYASGSARLFLNGKLLYRTKSTVRLVTDTAGNLQRAIGITPEKTLVILHHTPTGEKRFTIEANQSVTLDSA